MAIGGWQHSQIMPKSCNPMLSAWSALILTAGSLNQEWTMFLHPLGEQMDMVMGEGLGEQLAHAIDTINNAKSVVLPSFSRQEDIRLPEKGNSNSHGARPVY